jgi:hypothetical protein
VVWSVKVTTMSGGNSGVWATPAIYKDMFVRTPHVGALLGIDRESGEVVGRSPSASMRGEPVVVDKTLIIGDPTVPFTPTM